MHVSFGPVNEEREVTIEAGTVRLGATIGIPSDARGIVLFAHGSGSSRHSPRNRYVAQVLRNAGLGTLLLDLLTEDEGRVDEWTGHLRFDIQLLADRLVAATDWLKGSPETQNMRIGYFGASTGAGAALVAAAARPDEISAVVSRGGRPDLAGPALTRVKAPTLLIVGSLDLPVISLNEEAFGLLPGVKELRLVAGATHLFEEPGTLEEVARLATDWLVRYLSRAEVSGGSR